MEKNRFQMWLILAVSLLTKLQQLVNWIYLTAIRHNRDLYKFSECTNNEPLDRPVTE